VELYLLAYYYPFYYFKYLGIGLLIWFLIKVFLFEKVRILFRSWTFTVSGNFLLLVVKKPHITHFLANSVLTGLIIWEGLKL